MEYDYGAAAGSRQTYLHGNLIGTTEATSGVSPGSPPSAGRAVYTAFGERVYANGVGGGRYGYAVAWGYQAAGTEQCGPVGETYSCDPLEELGWLHVGERYYDPACGRFVQRDPIGIRGGANVYVYQSNEPSHSVDPSGLRTDFDLRMDPGARKFYEDWQRKRNPSGSGYPGPSGIAKQVFDQYNGKKSDKWMHFVVSCRITSEEYGGFVYLIPGSLLKEVMDNLGPNSAGLLDSYGDMLANLAGFGMGPGAAVGACNCEQEANNLGL